MGAVAAVFGDCRPLIFQHAGSWLSDIDHWLNGQHHAFPQSRTMPTRTVIGHLRLLVQARTDSVPDKIAHYAEAVGLYIFLHGCAYVADRLTQPDLFNRPFQ